MATHLLVDDLRDFRSDAPAENVTVARTSDAALALLHQDWTYIWLDHDLGVDSNGNPATIMPVVDELARRAFEGAPVKTDMIFVHTSNPIGGERIMRTLQHYGYRAARVDPSEFFAVQE